MRFSFRSLTGSMNRCLVNRPLCWVLTAVSLTATLGAGDSASKLNGSPLIERTFWSRYLQVLQFEEVTRFNYMDRGPGRVTDRDLQYRVRTRVQVNLAPEGTTYLRMRAETGKGFDNSWDNTGIGRGEGRWNFNMKSFALGQKLGSHVELQGGGIEFDPGAGSEHTYASGDGHMMGYRFLLTGSPHPWRPEKFSLTMGYVGDFHQPNVFSRFHLGKLNYVQALVQKKIGAYGEGSVEVDSIRDIWFTRQALRWRELFRPVVDDIMLETVTRTSDNPSFGWSAMVSRHLDQAQRWRAYAIYAHIPKALYDKGGRPVLMNRGEIDLGKRLAWGGSYAVNKDLELGVFAGRLLDSTPSKRWIAQFVVSYQYAHLINRLLR